jgi:hypothetical protein
VDVVTCRSAVRTFPSLANINIDWCQMERPWQRRACCCEWTVARKGLPRSNMGFHPVGPPEGTRPRVAIYMGGHACSQPCSRLRAASIIISRYLRNLWHSSCNESEAAKPAREVTDMQSSDRTQAGARQGEATSPLIDKPHAARCCTWPRPGGHVTHLHALWPFGEAGIAFKFLSRSRWRCLHACMGPSRAAGCGAA